MENSTNIMPDVSVAWEALSKHKCETNDLRVDKQFSQNPKRFCEFSLEAAGLFLDYSKNRITADTMKLLDNLAKNAQVAKHRDAMFSGQPINRTENRAVLHTILRDSKNNVLPEAKLVRECLNEMDKCVTKIRDGEWHGYSGKAITDVVNIGIGGSDLGAKMAVLALEPYAGHIKLHFVSNIDPTHISQTIRYLNPETTLFIVTSKTFTTQETLSNAIIAKDWLLAKAVSEENAIKRHFIGVTAKPDIAVEFGIDRENIFPIWDWVGGRFSLCSAVGLPIAISIGMENFYDLLMGARLMDEHFKSAPLEKNMPVILALLEIWNVNFLGATSRAVISYDYYLGMFPAYLQQLEMESNGKRVDLDGKLLSYNTCPVVWGGVGTDTQHSFHQLLMQGTNLVPVDFIVSLHTHNPIEDRHQLLYANCLAQSRALMCGYQQNEIIADLKSQGFGLEKASKLAPHREIPGNVPSNTIVIDKLTPRTLGALVALYEHKVFVEGVIWRINSFDQWGVALGKDIATNLAPMLSIERKNTDPKLDTSTAGLISLILNQGKAK